MSGQGHSPAALYPWERTLHTHWIGGWVGFRAGPDTEAREKNPLASARDRTPVVQCVVTLYWLSYLRSSSSSLNSKQMNPLSPKVTACWDITPCRLVEVDRHLTVGCCLHHQANRETKRHYIPESCHVCTRHRENLKLDELALILRSYEGYLCHHWPMLRCESLYREVVVYAMEWHLVICELKAGMYTTDRLIQCCSAGINLWLVILLISLPHTPWM
jgi:hypothetical protein